MKYLTKISSITATLALIFGLSFSASYANNGNHNQANSKKYTLQGKVVSSQSNQAVQGAKVLIFKNKNMDGSSMSKNQPFKKTTTNSNGKFKITGIPSGSYTIKVKADAYKTWKKQTQITKDGYLTIKIESSK